MQENVKRIKKRGPRSRGASASAGNKKTKRAPLRDQILHNARAREKDNMGIRVLLWIMLCLPLHKIVKNNMFTIVDLQHPYWQNLWTIGTGENKCGTCQPARRRVAADTTTARARHSMPESLFSCARLLLWWCYIARQNLFTSK